MALEYGGSYQGNPLLKPANYPISYTKEQIEEYVKCSKDPLYFIKNYIKIVNLDEGLVQFKPYTFQEKIVQTIHDNRFTICKIPRQSGKTTCVSAYLIWLILFTPNYKIAILANKADTAKDILGRLQTSYEHIPKWLQQGAVEWNKFSITLENGSKIIAAATSASAVRGSAYNCLVLDEFGHVPNNVAEEFLTSVYPTITSGKSTKLIMISTPKGLNLFYKTWINAVNKKNSYIPVECFWYDVPGRDEKFKAETIANTSEAQWDSEYNCSFVGSENTLISAAKLATIPFLSPFYTSSDGALKLYEPPQKNHIYTMCVDTSRGEGMDYHAFVIVDTTKVPYRVVGVYRNNKMSPSLYPSIITKTATQYNEAYVLIESNDLGQLVAELVFGEMEYGNLVLISHRGKRGQNADGGFATGGASKVMPGINMSYAVKNVGCSVLKDMVELDKIVIPDFDIISELSTYIKKGASYEATPGYYDDTVICLVMFGWLTTQSYFKDYTNTDLRERLFEEKMRQIEENVLPFGFINSSAEDFESEDGYDINYEKKSRLEIKKEEHNLWND